MAAGFQHLIPDCGSSSSSRIGETLDLSDATKTKINSNSIRFNSMKKKIIQYKYSSNVLICAPVSYVSNQRSIERNIHYCILPTSAQPEAGSRILKKKNKKNGLAVIFLPPTILTLNNQQKIKIKKKKKYHPLPPPFKKKHSNNNHK